MAVMTRNRLEGQHQERDDGDEPGTDEIFDVLSATERRFVLHYLSTAGEVLTLGELAEWLATQEGAGEYDAEELAIALHHGHLPRLADVDLIDYDPATRIVECKSTLAAAAPFLPAEDRG